MNMSKELSISDTSMQEKGVSSILEIAVEKFSEVEKTICMIRTELDVAPPGRDNKKNQPNTSQYDNINNLLKDSKVKDAIKSVVGKETLSLVDEKMRAVNSLSSMNDKHSVFKRGIEELQSSYRNSGVSIKNESIFNMAMSYAGMKTKK